MQRTAQTYYARPRDIDAPVLDGISRDGFVRLLKSIHQHLPCPVSKGAMGTFEQMTLVTRVSDWTTPSSEPCCFMAQVEIAEVSGYSAVRIRAHEAELVAAGLIEKRTMGNGARSGWKKRGIYFTPALARLEEFLAIKEQLEAQRAHHGHLRGLRSTHRRHLKSALEALSDLLGEEDPEVVRITEQFRDWPSADHLHRMPLPALVYHEAQADALCRETVILLENVKDSSAAPLENKRPYIQDTTPSPKNVVCNASVNKRTSGKPDDTKNSKDAPNGASCLENKARDADDAHKSEFMAKLGPDRLYSFASEEMQLLLDLRRARCNYLVFHDFVVAAQDRLHKLGINVSAWHEAVRVMGEDSAAMCVLILDASRNRPGLPVRNPGGYLRGMTRSAERGELNLVGSLIGLSERRRDD